MSRRLRPSSTLLDLFLSLWDHCPNREWTSPFSASHAVFPIVEPFIDFLSQTWNNPRTSMGSRTRSGGHRTVVVVAVDCPVYKDGEAGKGPIAPLPSLPHSLPGFQGTDGCLCASRNTLELNELRSHSSGCPPPFFSASNRSMSTVVHRSRLSISSGVGSAPAAHRICR